MGKIKLNLVSGAVVEKPLINAFTANNNSYVVLDNEMNGSMGLPIILVSKLENNKLIKIVDQNEWQVVKEYLKNIIAGGQISFIKISNEIAADDIYYTQLTLPIPSFDALKNAYKVEEESSEANNEEVGVLDLNLNQSAPVNEVSPQDSVTSEIQPQNVIPEAPINQEPVVDENKPIIDISNNVITPNISNIQPEPIQNEESVPNIDLNTPMPTFNPVGKTESEIQNNFEPEISPTPIINANLPEQPTITDDLFKEQKDAFMQACENMFDALVQKFEKELENRK